MQGFLDFLNQNITVVAGLFGVILGAGTSYLIQIGIGNRQRKWQLEDETRQHKIEQLRDLKKSVHEYDRIYTEQMNLYGQGIF